MNPRSSRMMLTRAATIAMLTIGFGCASAAENRPNESAAAGAAKGAKKKKK